MRYKEEVNRTKTIEAEIAELQKKMKRSYSDIPIGDHLTPRPRWTERLDVVTTYRLPAPKLTLDAADLHEEQEDSGIMDAGEDEMRRSQRGGASRRDLNQSMRKPALGLSTTNSFASMGGRKKTAGGGGYSFFGGSMMKGMSFLMPRGGGGAMAGQHAEVTDTTCGSFREMMLRIRERLSVQSELLRLAQENIKDFKDHYGHPLDLVANLCALNVASAGSCISKHAATAVQPIGQSGALVPQPSWSPHELAQRSLALWAAVLDGLVAKGDLSITHMEQTTPQALLRLVQRRCLASVASMSASQRAALYGMHGAARGGGTPQQRRSNQSALPEPAPFPAGREGSLSSPASTATPLTRAASGSTSRPAQVSISGTAATPTTPAGTHNGSHGATTATTSSTTMTFGKAVADEIQFAQLWHTLTKQLEAYANHVAGCAPSLLDSSFAGGGSSQVGLQRRASVASFNGKNNALKRGGGNSGGRPLGDALRAIHVLGVDPDTGAPLDRIAVVTAMALIAFSVPPRMLEDVGTFLEAVEQAAMETSSSEETVSAVAAHACGDWIGVRSFVQRVKDVCSVFGFGSIAAGELESHILRVSVGGTVPIGLGGAVGQSGVLGTSVSAVGGGAATGASPSPSSTLLPHHNNSNDSFASPMKHNAASSPSKDMGGGGGGSGSSGAYLLRDVRLPSSLSSRSASTTSLAWSSKVSLGETTVTSTKYPHHSSNSSNGMAALDRRSFAASGNLASNHSTIGGSSNINRAGSKVSPLSATALAEESSLEASSTHTPSSSIVPYRTVFAVGPQWKGFLDCVVKHHQLQQHHILYWLSKTLVEHCFPSETMPGVFVIPARILETKLPQHYWNVDDPMFPDIGAMMDYYHRYPMPLVKEERRRSTGLAVPTSSGSAGASRGSGSRGEKPIDGSAWKLHVTRLMETIIQACDAGAGSEHFPAASPTSRGGSGAAVKKKPFALQMTDDPLEWSVSSDSSPAVTSSPKGRAVFTTPPSSPRASPRSQPQSGSTGGAHRKGSGEAGGQRSPSNGNNNATTRNSKGSSIVSLHTQETAGPTTPLGVYLRYAQRASQAAKKTSSSTTGDEVSYVWRPPTQRPATQDDFYDVEEVFQHLSTTPLRQYMYQ
ncbi:unnamed protein product [Bodo saltans]|uniref:Uncharacterized protein n=1 Tax=Bodo saltans TaxID=75058 RepID=A0A0S4KK85_BODSA|nr:unnamed protein product [Bodo saltans]|eukprot:CUI14994.1 unnamed protein product [Bodo saltans]